MTLGLIDPYSAGADATGTGGVHAVSPAVRQRAAAEGLTYGSIGNWNIKMEVKVRSGTGSSYANRSRHRYFSEVPYDSEEVRRIFPTMR